MNSGAFKPGHKKLGGRQKGAGNTRSRVIAEKAAANGLTPLEYLVSVMRDKTLELAVRVDAAKAAAPFMHPRLQAIEARVEVTDDFAARLTRARNRAGTTIEHDSSEQLTWPALPLATSTSP